MSVSQVIKNALKTARKSQEDLASELNVSRETVNKRLAIGDVDEDMLRGTAKLTGISFEILFLEFKRHKMNEPDVYQLRETIESLQVKNRELSHELEKKELIIQGLKREVDLLTRLTEKQ